MNEFTFEEMNLMAIYNANSTREGLIAALTEMRGYLDADEAELMAMTDSVLKKLNCINDATFAKLKLIPDFRI